MTHTGRLVAAHGQHIMRVRRLRLYSTHPFVAAECIRRHFCSIVHAFVTKFVGWGLRFVHACDLLAAWCHERQQRMRSHQLEGMCLENSRLSCYHVACSLPAECLSRHTAQHGQPPQCFLIRTRTKSSGPPSQKKRQYTLVIAVNGYSEKASRWRTGRGHACATKLQASVSAQGLATRPQSSIKTLLKTNTALEIYSIPDYSTHSKAASLNIVKLLGAMFQRLWTRLSTLGHQEGRVIFMGLDAAGKTTILYMLKLGEVVTTIPTIGKCRSFVVYENEGRCVLDSFIYINQRRHLVYARAHMLGCKRWGFKGMALGTSSVSIHLLLGCALHHTVCAVHAGFNVETIKAQGMDITAWDVGGELLRCVCPAQLPQGLGIREANASSPSCPPIHGMAWHEGRSAWAPAQAEVACRWYCLHPLQHNGPALQRARASHHITSQLLLGRPALPWPAGCDKIRPLWRHYFQGLNALVFVVDSNDYERMEEAKEEMQRMLNVS